MKKRLAKYYRDFTYDECPCVHETRKVTDSDMCDHDTLMDMKDDIWTTLSEEDLTARERKWLTDLYGDLSDYIECGYDRKAVEANDKMNKISLVVGCVCTLLFAACLQVSFDWMTIGGLVLSAAVSTVACVNLPK